MSAAAHLSRVRSLPCVVCVHMGMKQATPTEAHHVESVRDGLSDFATAAVCVDHHTGQNGIHGLHRRAFEMRYRLSDVDLLAMTIKLLDKGYASAEADAVKRCAKQVPITWLDPLLTGPDAVLKGEGGTWGCREIEALLRGIQDRIRALGEK